METYKIARGASCRATRWKNVSLTWDEILNKLHSPARTGETVAEYKQMSKAQRAEAKDCGGFVGGELANGRRSNRTVRNRSLITLDGDKAVPGQWENVAAMYDYKMAMYSTHSHTPEAPRLRWVLPLDRPVTPDEYGAIARRIAEELGIETMDRTTYEPARLMYWPSCPQDGEYLYRHQDGPEICADAVLASYGPGDAWKDTSLWPTSRDEAAVVKAELLELGDPREKPGLVGVFCRIYNVEDAILEFLSEIYEPCDGYSAEPRYTYTGGSTCGGASVYNDGQYLFSRHDTDPAGGGIHSQNAFDLVRIHKFGHLDKGGVSPDPTRAPSYKAMCDWMLTLDVVKDAMARERMESVAEEFGDLVEQPAGEDPTEDEEPNNNWVQQLTYKPKTKDLEATIGNALLILRNDPRLRGALAYNELLERVVIRRPLPWHKQVRNQQDGDTWTDTDRSNLFAYMERAWGLKSRADILDAFAATYAENAWNPLRDYLDGLVWDGVERLDTMLIRWFRAEDTPYTRAVSRKWFTAAVARVYQPGRKFDNMLVLSGKQGLGKSSFAQIMSKGRFTDSISDLRGKGAYEQLRGVWLVEIPELASFKRTDVEVIKNFISKSEDTYRGAYQEFTRTYKRQCVFFGTTNDLEFLRDRTGARRFWPVECQDFPGGVVPEEGALVGLEDEVDQVWAEAVVRYRGGEPLWLQEAALQEAAREAQESATVQDELVGMIQAYLDRRLPENWESLDEESRVDFIQGRSGLNLAEEESFTLQRNRISITEIRCELCGEEAARNGGNDLQSRRIANIMNTLPGWHRGKNRPYLGGYGRQRVYWRNGFEERSDRVYTKVTK